MGFQLGRALGRVAGAAIGTATRGLIRPSFVKPAIARTNPFVSLPVQQPDSIVTSSNLGFGAVQRRSVQYFTQPGQNKQLPAGGLNQAALAMPHGCKLNKSTYVTRGGGTSRWPQQLIVHEKGTECVKRRRMNPGNGRAALHAVRRLVGFYNLSQRVAKQLRRAAAKAHIRGARHGQRRLPAGRQVEVVNVE